MSHKDNVFGPNGADDDDFVLPFTLEFFLKDKDLEKDLKPLTILRFDGRLSLMVAVRATEGERRTSLY